MQKRLFGVSDMETVNLIQLPALTELVRANAITRVEIQATADGFKVVARLPGQPPRVLALQRGGIRYFKTSDAALTFVRNDLGMRHADFNLNELPATPRRALGAVGLRSTGQIFTR